MGFSSESGREAGGKANEVRVSTLMRYEKNRCPYKLLNRLYRNRRSKHGP